jgi:hypothetical protein
LILLQLMLQMRTITLVYGNNRWVVNAYSL